MICKYFLLFYGLSFNSLDVLFFGTHRVLILTKSIIYCVVVVACSFQVIVRKPLPNPRL